ncbi:nitroreductase family protein [Phreatobacter stygius]|uniref:nitroreductase family protein n=1 Tax=Phreatobacter stygius TaxID=1940610 RepID=UPI002680DFD1
MITDYQPIPLPDYREMPLEEMRRRAAEFYDMVRQRHTVRDFSPRPVPRDLIDTCLRAAGTAPNGANHQPWHFCVIGDPGVKRRIREAAEEEEERFYAGKAGEEWLAALKPLGTDPHKPFLETAPWLICIFGARKSPSADGVLRKNYYVPESVNIATGILLTALHYAGLTTLTHTPNPMGFLNEICGRPETEKPYILMVVGYPADDATIPAHAIEKKPLNEIASYL